MIDYLDQKNIDYEYTNGWSEAYDNIQFEIGDIQYELETAVNSLSYIIDNDNKIGVTVELDECSNVDELLREIQLKVEMKKLDDISVNMYGVNGYRFEYHDQDLVNVISSFNSIENYMDNLISCFDNSLEDKNEIEYLKNNYMLGKIRKKDDKMI